MHKVFSFIALIMVPALASAGVYKWVDANGAVHFSDVPQEGAEEVHIAPPQTYSAPSLPPITPRSEVLEAPAEYSEFSLAIPEPDANIWGDVGVVDVSFTSEPSLQIERGHKLVVLVDGQPRPAVTTSSVTLENVERGSHQLQGQIVDSLGKVIIASQSITVHVHRQSALLSKPKQPAPNKPAP